MRACRRNDLNLVSRLYGAGFRVSSVLSRDGQSRAKKPKQVDADEVDAAAEDAFDFVAELRLLEASARPVYIISEAKTEVKKEQRERIRMREFVACAFCRARIPSGWLSYICTRAKS